MDEKYSVINIYDAFKRKYKDYIKPEIESISIIQSDEEVLLQTVECEKIEGGFIKETINKVNLDFITDGDHSEEEMTLFFDPSNSIENNVLKFMEEFTPYSIINTTDLFHENACEKINKKYLV